MKKISLLLLLAGWFLLAGCGGQEELAGTFQAGRAELAAAAKMPNNYTYQDISLRYPGGWKPGLAPLGTQLVLNKQTSGTLFQANFKLVTLPSDPRFMKMTAEEIKDAIRQTAGANIKNMDVIKLEKGKWQGVDAIYIEYKVHLLEQDIIWAQYYYDTGQHFHALVFAAAASEWSALQKEARQIFCSVAFKK